MSKKLIIFLFTLFIFISCQKIETGETLNKKTIHFIKSLHLLDSNEHIVKYYSNFREKKAGNFFTDKRIAHYWIDDEPSLTEISFAYYTDIIAIDTQFFVFDFDIPYMTIWKKDSSKFRVFIDGSDIEQREFMNEAIGLWKKSN